MVVLPIGVAVLSLFAVAFKTTRAQSSTSTSTSSPTGLANINSCAEICYGLAVGRSQCDTINDSCICASAVFFLSLQNCLESGDTTCTEAQSDQVWAAIQSSCAPELSTTLGTLTFFTVSATGTGFETGTFTILPVSNPTSTIASTTGSGIESTGGATTNPTTLVSSMTSSITSSVAPNTTALAFPSSVGVVVTSSGSSSSSSLVGSVTSSTGSSSPSPSKTGSAASPNFHGALLASIAAPLVAGAIIAIL